jgi:hypothetical protein
VGFRNFPPVNPLQRPLGLALDAGDSVNRVEELVLQVDVLDITLQKQAVHLCVVYEADLSTSYSTNRMEQLRK